MGCEASICVDANVRPARVGTDRETVVLLHGSASNSALWRHTKGALQSRYRCIAPDLIGYGSSAAWPQQAAFGLDAELRAIEQSLQCCADTFHLVGYSYGGVLALHLALADPRRVQSLTLIEPVFFAALKYAGDWTSYFEFCRVRDEFVTALARGDRELAMRRFVDFWMGNDAWVGLSADIRASMLEATDKTCSTGKPRLPPIPADPAFPRWPCGRCWCVAATARAPCAPWSTHCTRSCLGADAPSWKAQATCCRGPTPRCSRARFSQTCAPARNGARMIPDS